MSVNSEPARERRTISHYTIEERIGAGAMGEVYRGRDERLGRPVALKFLPSARQADPALRSRMLREARAASVLRSPHTAAIYDIGEDDGAIFIVMELVEGETLSDRLASSPLPVVEAVDVAIQIADALDEAHERSILHRDVKSANVMIDTRGRVKVLDFGLAKFLAGADDASAQRTLTQGLKTGTGLVLGTVSYMSPEQALGRALDVRTDLFSLGVVTYEMLTGRRPFEGGASGEVLDKLLHHEPPPPSRFAYDVPDVLDSVVLRLLAKQPARRYASARDLRDELETVRREFDGRTEAATPGSRDRSERPGPTSAGRAGSSGASAARRPDAAVAVMTFSNITRREADDWIGSGIAETVTTDLKRVQGISVIGRAQVFGELKDVTSDDLARLDDSVALDVGRRLGAAWIVGGAYQRVGPNIRITAQLVEVESGTLLKTVKVDGDTERIFDLQDRIVYQLGQGLHLELDDSDIRSIERRETMSVPAYEAFSHGMMNLRLATPASIDRAIDLFEKAVELDPRYASAWAAAGSAFTLKGMFLASRDLASKGLEAIERGLELDPEHAEGQYWLAMALTGLGEIDRAIAAGQRAVELDASSASAHAGLARAYWLGRGDLDQGIAGLERCVELEPSAGYAHLQLALLYALRGQYDEAETAARRAVELQERALSGTEGLQILGAHVRLGYVHYRRARYGDAIAEYERGLAFLSSTDHALRDRTLLEAHQKLGAAYFRLGQRERSDHHLEQATAALEERLARDGADGSSLYYVGSLHALRGEVEPAVRLLSMAIERLPAFTLARARLDPDLDPIRDEPDFLDLLEDRP